MIVEIRDIKVSWRRLSFYSLSKVGEVFNISDLTWSGFEPIIHHSGGEYSTFTLPVMTLRQNKSHNEILH